MRIKINGAGKPLAEFAFENIDAISIGTRPGISPVVLVEIVAAAMEQMGRRVSPEIGEQARFDAAGAREDDPSPITIVKAMAQMVSELFPGLPELEVELENWVPPVMN